MTAPARAAGRNPWLTAAAWRRLLRDKPLIPLTILLALLVVALELAAPGTVGAAWVGVTLRAAVPLAILAGCQTLAMLTGGIDLSVGTVASMAAFIMATLVTGQGPVVAIIAGFVAGGLGGPRQRHRDRHLQGPPADHDPGHEPGRARADGGLPARDGPGRGLHPRRRRLAARASISSSCRTASSSSSRSRR